MHWNGAVTFQNERISVSQGPEKSCSATSPTLHKLSTRSPRHSLEPLRGPRTHYLMKQFISFLEFKFLECYEATFNSLYF